jgi:two-component system, OmpR family, KDP operon response regulator KdpE
MLTFRCSYIRTKDIGYKEKFILAQEEIKVLIVDDDTDFLKLVEEVLEFENYQIIEATTGKQAVEMVKVHNPSLVLLDIMLPDGDGYTVCRRIRSISSVPVVMVTGKVTPEDKIVGLDAGADDYITKPFYAGEFCARVRAALRRNPSIESSRTFRYEDLLIDYQTQTVTLDGRNVELSMTEFRVLALLARNANRVVPPEEILSTVWGEDNPESHVVTMTISRIRQKLHDGERFKYIYNKPGCGYMMSTN